MSTTAAVKEIREVKGFIVRNRSASACSGSTASAPRQPISFSPPLNNSIRRMPRVSKFARYLPATGAGPIGGARIGCLAIPKKIVAPCGSDRSIGANTEVSADALRLDIRRW
jgi:hypothetical protein